MWELATRYFLTHDRVLRGLVCKIWFSGTKERLFGVRFALAATLADMRDLYWYNRASLTLTLVFRASTRCVARSNVIPLAICYVYVL